MTTDINPRPPGNFNGQPKPLKTEVSLEKEELALSAGTFSQGGRLFLFTVQEVDDEGLTKNLSMDRHTRSRIEDTLIRLFQANEAGARRGVGSYLGHKDLDGEFIIALNSDEANPIKVKNSGGHSISLEQDMVSFLKGNQSKDSEKTGFNFLKDLQRTVLSKTYKSSYLDSLTEQEREERTQTLQQLDKAFSSYDKIATNLRAPKYANFNTRKTAPQSLWLSPQTLLTVSQDLAAKYSRDDARLEYQVADPLIISRDTKDFSIYIENLKKLSKEKGLKGIAIPVHKFYAEEDPGPVYGLFIDLEKNHIYFYNPSNTTVKDDAAIALFLKELSQELFNEKCLRHTKVKKHQGFHPWEPVRKFKHHLTAIEKRSFSEEKEMTYFSDDDNYGRYVLKFFDEMLKGHNKEKAYNDFVSKRIRREQIEDYADTLAEDLLSSYNRRYAEVHAFIKV